MAMTITSKVVGVTYAPGYPDTILRLHDAWTIREIHEGRTEPLAAVLIRNPQNEHDGNAIEVHVPALGQMIGHVWKIEAAYLAPRIDAGEVWAAQIVKARINPEHPDRPGIELSIRQVSGVRGAILRPKANAQ